MNFSYSEAFLRNIGWVTTAEQDILSTKHIAIAGLGGVGGIYLTTLLRLGIQHFSLAEADIFELKNFNRQVGATIATIDQPKTTAMAEMARMINPNVKLRIFPEGLTDDNLVSFLDGVDLYICGLDYFAIEMREKIMAECNRRGIPAVFAAPLGMGAAMLYFKPGGMSFENYFCLRNDTVPDKLIKFLIGIAPTMMQRGYVVDPAGVNMAKGRLPSTIMGCTLCAGITATQALKILLKRGNVPAVPRIVHYDAYLNCLRHSWVPWGNRNPIQRLKFMIARSILRRYVQTTALGTSKNE